MTPNRSPFTTRALVPGLLAAAAALTLFHPVVSGKVLGRHIVGPVAPEAGRRGMIDIEVQMLPFLYFNRLCYGQGIVPLWNPRTGCGAPFLANEQSASLHPFTWLALIPPWRWGLVVAAVAKWVLAMLGTFLLARELGLDAAAAMVSAAAFATSGGLVGWLCYPVGTVFAHLPLALWLAWRQGQTSSFRHGVALILVLTSSVLAGHLEYLPVLWFLVAATWVAAAGVRRVPALLGLMAAAVTFSGAMLLPSVEYLSLSLMGSDRSESHANPPSNPRVLAAIVDARRLDPEIAPRVTGPTLMRHANFHLGALALVLAAAGAGTPRGRRLTLLTLLSALLIWSFPWSRWLWSWPLLRIMDPGKLVVIPGLGLSLLAGFGVSSPRRRGALLALIGLALSMLLLLLSPDELSPLPPLAPAIIGVILLTLPRHRGTLLTLLLGAALIADRSATLGKFNPWESPTRLFPPSRGLELAAGEAGHDRVAAAGRVLFPNLALAYGLSDIRVYDAIGIEKVAHALQATTLFGLHDQVPTPRTRIAAARILLGTEPVPCDGCRTLGCEPPLCVTLDSRALPRARWASRPLDRSLVEIQHETPTRVELRAATDRPDRLILADSFYPGWTAEVDGRPQPVEMEGPFRALSLDTGDHRVRMRYHPPSFKLGLFWSALSALGCACLIASRIR